MPMDMLVEIEIYLNTDFKIHIKNCKIQRNGKFIKNKQLLKEFRTLSVQAPNENKEIQKLWSHFHLHFKKEGARKFNFKELTDPLTRLVRFTAFK
ncbi:hypothetical protein HZS_5384 [Henneguya salminicola]|nr:hypothetical protein HZS_5384 [Henneguya salminicola]